MSRVGRLVIALGLLVPGLVTSLQPLSTVAMPSSVPIHYTRAVAEQVSVTLNTAAVAGTERYPPFQHDVNGDGDLNDYGLQIYRRHTDSVTFVENFPGRVVGVSDSTVAFMGTGYENDPTCPYDDRFSRPGFYDIANGTISTPDLPRIRYDDDPDYMWISSNGDRLVAQFIEGECGAGDIDGDGDTTGTVTAYYDVARQRLIPTPVMSVAPVIYGDVIVYHKDLRTVAYYNVVTGEVVDTGILVGRHFDAFFGPELTVTAHGIGFSEVETPSTSDINEDGYVRYETVISGYYEFATGNWLYFQPDDHPGKVDVAHGIDGGYLYGASEPSIWPIPLDLNGDGDTSDNFIVREELTSAAKRYFEMPFPVHWGTIAAVADSLALRVSEVDAGRDLTGDGWIAASILAYAPLLETDSPIISVTSPTATTFTQNQRVLANYTCADDPGGSGLAACTGSVPTGKRIDTSTPGQHTFTVTATDYAGNTASQSVTYSVIACDPELDLTGALRHEIGRDGLQVGSLKNTSLACRYPVGLAVYAITSGTHAQRLLDWQTATIGPDGKLQLAIALPDCRARVVLFYGQPIKSPAGTARYGTRAIATRTLPGPPCP